MNDNVFWDSNLWIYLFTKSEHPDDIRKRKQLETMLRQRPKLVSSVQVLNEVANALFRKYACPENEVREFLEKIVLITDNQALTKAHSLHALELKQRYPLGWYDSLIVAVALYSVCAILFTEDLHDGLVIEDALTITNPFKD